MLLKTSPYTVRNNHLTNYLCSYSQRHIRIIMSLRSTVPHNRSTLVKFLWNIHQLLWVSGVNTKCFSLLRTWKNEHILINQLEQPPTAHYKHRVLWTISYSIFLMWHIINADNDPYSEVKKYNRLYKERQWVRDNQMPTSSNCPYMNQPDSWKYPVLYWPVSSFF